MPNELEKHNVMQPVHAASKLHAFMLPGVATEFRRGEPRNLRKYATEYVVFYVENSKL